MNYTINMINGHRFISLITFITIVVFLLLSCEYNDSGKQAIYHFDKFIHHFDELFVIKDELTISGNKDRPVYNYTTPSITNDKIIFPVPILHSVDIYNSDGEYIETWGRRGKGPGEFEYPVNIKITPDNQLTTILDWGNKRIKVYDEFGSLNSIILLPGNLLSKDYFIIDNDDNNYKYITFILTVQSGKSYIIQEIDGEGKQQNYYGIIDRDNTLLYSWRAALSADNKLYVSNVIIPSIDIYSLTGKLTGNITIDNPSVKPLNTSDLPANQAEKQIEGVERLRNSKYTRVDKILTDNKYLYIQLESVNIEMDNSDGKYSIAIYTLEGEEVGFIPKIKERLISIYDNNYIFFSKDEDNYGTINIRYCNLASIK